MATDNSGSQARPVPASASRVSTPRKSLLSLLLTVEPRVTEGQGLGSAQPSIARADPSNASGSFAVCFPGQTPPDGFPLLGGFFRQ